MIQVIGGGGHRSLKICWGGGKVSPLEGISAGVGGWLNQSTMKPTVATNGRAKL